MNLPVSGEYLSSALCDGATVGNVKLEHRRVGDLVLPTGELVACDPLVCPEREPFELKVPVGRFPVILSIADLNGDQRVAFATIRFEEAAPTAWDMMTLGGADRSKLGPGEFFGYPVDAGTGCFMDRMAAETLDRMMTEDSEYFWTIIHEMEETEVNTWSWADMPFGKGNMIVFSSGFGDGVYATYVGFDEGGKVIAVVADFAVVQLD